MTDDEIRQKLSEINNELDALDNEYIQRGNALRQRWDDLYAQLKDKKL